jgi:long-chain acyl-CoA synthetase
VTLFQMFQARVLEHPTAEAVIYGRRRITYAELALEVDRVARGLQERGIQRGDRVLALAGNIPEVITIYLAVGRIGAVYVPVSAGFREREGRFILANAEPRLAFVAAAQLQEFLDWSEGRNIDVIVLDDQNPTSGMQDFKEFGKGTPWLLPRKIDEHDGVLLCYTSGTTSTPKPVLHSQASEAYNAATYARVWDLGPGDRGIVCLPLAWVYGLSTTTAALLSAGGTVVLLDRFHPVAVIDAIEEHRATAMWGTMHMYTKMLEVLSKRESVDLSSLRILNNGGEPCPPPLVKGFEDHTGLHLLGSYATSEARPITLVRPGDTTAPEGTVGKLVPGAEIRLVAPDGSEVPVGEVGHALLRCPGLMTEYYREPSLTAERLTPDGWLKTGDLLKVDAEGYYFVVGRQTDMIIRSGANVAPAEVESALVTHPSIAVAAVVGVPDVRSGEAIRAVVVAEPGTSPTEDELRQALSDQLAAYKVPQEFIFVAELPRTDRGKIDRHALQVLKGAEQ